MTNGKNFPCIRLFSSATIAQIMIASLVSKALPEIHILCQRQGVERMSLFGSATTEHFSPETSDVDCLVKFFDEESIYTNLVDRFFDLTDALERTLKCPVDLITERSISNPVFREIVEKSKVLIYDATTSKIPH